jgi:Tfp pilus assembly protein PilN
MAEIDLIPQAYRETQRAKRWVKLFLIACGLLLLTVVLARVILGRFTKDIEAPLVQLQQQETTAAQQRAEIDTLRASKAQAEKQWQILQGLRGNPVTEALFKALDLALPEGVWFQDFKFLREGQFVEMKPETKPTGYFIIVPKDGKNPQAGEQAWRVQRHVEIHGQAVDQTALTQFIERLQTQNGISNVRLLNTTMREYGSKQAIEFNLIALVDSGPVKQS